MIDMEIEAQRAVRRITDHQEIVKQYQKVVRAYKKVYAGLSLEEHRRPNAR